MVEIPEQFLNKLILTFFSISNEKGHFDYSSLSLDFYRW